MINREVKVIESFWQEAQKEGFLFKNETLRELLSRIRNAQLTKDELFTFELKQAALKHLSKQQIVKLLCCEKCQEKVKKIQRTEVRG
jgi:hypothetical protein